MEMKAGRELDALVAEKVMGWERGDTSRGFMKWYPAGKRHKSGCGEFDIPGYSTDIAAAWEVVEKLGTSGRWVLHLLAPQDADYVMRDGETVQLWRAKFEKKFWDVQKAEPYEWPEGLTAPHAICNAALMLVEGWEKAVGAAGGV